MITDPSGLCRTLTMLSRPSLVDAEDRRPGSIGRELEIGRPAVVVDRHRLERRLARDIVVRIARAAAPLGRGRAGGTLLVEIAEVDAVAQARGSRADGERAQLEGVDVGAGIDGHVGRGALDERLDREHVAALQADHLPGLAVAHQHRLRCLARVELERGDELHRQIEAVDRVAAEDVLLDPGIGAQGARVGLGRDHRARCGEDRQRGCHGAPKGHSCTSRFDRVSASTR